jgi:predicted short-subunit dehydrogenase-like oxidoreductase (DUF2520 family)
MLRDMASCEPGNKVTLVGAGNLAHMLAEYLPKAGFPIAEIVTRSGSPRSRALARKVGVQLHTIGNAKWSGGIVWLAVSDSAIREVAAALAHLGGWKKRVVLHSSGALSSEELAPLRRRGARVASTHPMMTLVPGKPPDMAGVVWTVEGDAAALAEAKRIVRSLGGRAITIDRRQKPLYHAFGAFLSPLLVVHLKTASQMAIKAGIPRRDLARLMYPIIKRTLQNFLANVGKQAGAGKAFSGPLIRGDVETIKRHLRSLRSSPEAQRIYEALVIAAVKSDLPVKNRSQIAKALAKGAQREWNDTREGGTRQQGSISKKQ